MRKRVTLMACAIAALAWTQAPASAQSLDTSGDVSASTGSVAGTTDTASTSGGSALGGSGPTTGNVAVGGGGSGPVTGSATIGSGTTSGGSPSGSVVVGTGANPVAGGTTGTVTINPDGTVSVSTGTGTSTAPSTSTGGGAGGSGLSGPQIQTALANLDDADIAALKLKCQDVLGNPGAYSAATVAVCQTLASL